MRDRGEGLKDGQLEKIFQPFYTTKDNGLGLGLAISRSIVEAHGGTAMGAEQSRSRCDDLLHRAVVTREKSDDETHQFCSDRSKMRVRVAALRRHIQRIFSR